MIARITERVMNLLLSALMVVLFIVIAPFWTLVYGSILLKDYMSFARA